MYMHIFLSYTYISCRYIYREGVIRRLSKKQKSIHFASCMHMHILIASVYVCVYVYVNVYVNVYVYAYVNVYVYVYLYVRVYVHACAYNWHLKKGERRLIRRHSIKICIWCFKKSQNLLFIPLKLIRMIVKILHNVLNICVKKIQLMEKIVIWEFELVKSAYMCICMDIYINMCIYIYACIMYTLYIYIYNIYILCLYMYIYIYV